MKTYVVDTNIILDNVDNLFKLFDKENQIIIPETVVDELDTKKTLFDEIASVELSLIKSERNKSVFANSRPVVSYIPPIVIVGHKFLLTLRTFNGFINCVVSKYGKSQFSIPFWYSIHIIWEIVNVRVVDVEFSHCEPIPLITKPDVLIDAIKFFDETVKEYQKILRKR